MSSNLRTAIIFIGGVIAGSVVTSYLVKNKYESLINEEIESIKEAYENNYPSEDEVITYETDVKPEKKDIKEYSELAAKYRASEIEEDENEDSDREDVAKIEPVKNPNIYEISEEEYGELDQFDCIECTLYSDGILADDDDGVIDDVDETVGSVNLEVLDEENSLIYIRNEYKMVDYAISYDTRDYVSVQRSAHRIH